MEAAEDVKSYGEYENYGDAMNFSSVHSKFDYTDLFNSLNGTENFTVGVIRSDGSTSNSTSMGRDERLAKIEQAVLTLIFIFTILGNFFVLIGIYFRKQKMTRMYYFILHLSIADLTTAFFNVLTQLFWEITHRFQGGAFMCKFVKYTQILGPYSSSYILVMTALDRYQAICYPLSNCSWTAKRSKVMLGTAWIFSFLFCLPQLYIFNYQEIKANSGVFDCWATFEPYWGEKAYITWYCITVFIVPLIILIFAYTCITRAIWVNFNMKNAAFKEDHVGNGSRLTKGDSDDRDDQELDNSLDGHENAGGNKKGRFLETFRKSKRSPAGRDLNTAKHLEVSWHQKKQGTQTKASVSQHVAFSKAMPQSHTQSQSFSDNQVNHNNDIRSISPRPRYLGDEHQNLRNISPCNGDNQPDSPTSIESHVNSHMNGGSVHVHHESFDNGKSSASDKRRKWKSISSRFTKKKNADPSFTQDPDHNNADFENKHKKESKRLLLTPNDKGHKSSFEVSRAYTSSIRSSSKYSHVQIQPRAHSVKGISRAKIKTVKLTITVICCYIICSTPFIAALLWSAYDPYAHQHPFFYGPVFTILTLLASLNSCVNAWIVLGFNPNLFQSFRQGICPKKHSPHQLPGGPNSMNASQRRLLTNKKSLNADSRQTMATSVTALSPLMDRLTPKENSNPRSKNRQDSVELVHPVVDVSNSRFLSSPNRNHHTNQKRHDNTTPMETSFIGI